MSLQHCLQPLVCFPGSRSRTSHCTSPIGSTFCRSRGRTDKKDKQDAIVVGYMLANLAMHDVLLQDSSGKFGIRVHLHISLHLAQRYHSVVPNAIHQRHLIGLRRYLRPLAFPSLRSLLSLFDSPLPHTARLFFHPLAVAPL